MLIIISTVLYGRDGSVYVGTFNCYNRRTATVQFFMFLISHRKWAYQAVPPKNVICYTLMLLLKTGNGYFVNNDVLVQKNW